MRTKTACRMSCLLKRKGASHTSLKEHTFVSSIIRRDLCNVTPAMPTWGLSLDLGPRTHYGWVQWPGGVFCERKSL